jgi:hypothetical protein
LRIMPPSVQELLAASMVPVTVCSGQDLIKEGRPTEHLWLLHSGRPQAHRHYKVLKCLIKHFFKTLTLVYIFP